MAYKRKTTRGRFGKRKMRRAMNVSRPRRVYNNVSSQKVLVKRTFYWGNWTPSTASVTGYWRYFSPTLADLPSYTDLTSMFDQIKISRVKITLRPRYDGFAGNDTVDTTLPGVTNQGLTMVHVIKDPLSKITPVGTYNSTTLNQFLENGAVKSYQGTKPINIYFKPYVNNALAGVSSAQRIPAPYIDADQTGIFHCGCHVFLQDVNLTGTFNQAFDLFVTYYMVARGSR